MSNSNFTVIDCKQEVKNAETQSVRLEQIYLKAFSRNVLSIATDMDWKAHKEDAKRAVFYMVKYFGLRRVNRKISDEPRTFEEVQSDFQLLECVKMVMAQLTPRDMMSMFPIKKRF